MPNMKPEKTPMPAQDPIVRSTNFEEVEYGYTHEMALEEAQRCLQCKHAPCMTGCPVQVQIPLMCKVKAVARLKIRMYLFHPFKGELAQHPTARM